MKKEARLNMLMPRREKRRKQFRGRMNGIATRNNLISHGEYGIISLDPCWIKGNQIEAARIAMTRSIKRGGDVFIKIFPHKPISKKPAEVRMGSGKGNVEYHVAVVKPGTVLFEMGGVSEEVAREALRLASHKLPCNVKIVSKAELAEDVAKQLNGVKRIERQQAIAAKKLGHLPRTKLQTKEAK
jgi:large subunit ribosomal protein L16